MDIKLVEATSKNAMNYFIRFPKELYRDDPNFVFEPESLQRKFLSDKNPFFRLSSARFFIAISDGKIVGRIAAIDNTVHNKTFGEKTGFFGFFDVVDRLEVSTTLLDKVTDIHRQNGFNKLMGPTNFTTNDSCGVGISGYEKPPVVLMPYNKPYYDHFLTGYGFQKSIDLSSYYFGDRVMNAPYLGKMNDSLFEKLKKGGITIRNIRFRELDQEIVEMRKVYNDSNKHNWGFIPLGEEEFAHMARQFRQFVPEEMVFIAEKNGRQIAFLVALPDLNQVFRKIPSGKLFPVGFIQYLWHRKKIDRARILILGVLQEYRHRGIDPAMYELLRQYLTRSGFKGGEACYVMENNGMMHSIIQKMGCEKVNEYRIYEMDI